MAVITHSDVISSVRSYGFAQGFTDFLYQIGTRLRQTIVERQTRTALERLSNRQLADIGMTREQIESVAMLAGRP